MSGYLRDVGRRPERPARDPMGKAALFSEGGQPGFSEGGQPGFSEGGDPRFTESRRGTVVIECGSCAASTRVSYVDFALGSLPFSLWLPPIPSIRYNRRMTCPACAEWTWVRARWLG